MKAGKQTTLRTHAAVSGIGVHSGLPATLTMLPADPNTGIVFVRLGQGGQPDREIRADFRAVTATEFATVLGDANGPLCSTAEHVLAALSGLGIDNCIIELDGPEVPIMDGSAAPFVAAIDRAGIVTQNAKRRYLKVLKTVRAAQDGATYGELRPYACGFRVEVDIEFNHPLIGHQALALEIEPGAFRREISRARTFGFMREVEALRAMGLARGGSLDNAVVLDEYRILNTDGLRYEDEFVRHKVLDAIGDLYMLGHPLVGAFTAYKSGHALNNRLLRTLLADSSAWEYATYESPEEAPRGFVQLLAQTA